jgi:hypothetical protein
MRLPPPIDEQKCRCRQEVDQTYFWAVFSQKSALKSKIGTGLAPDGYFSLTLRALIVCESYACTL